MTTTSPVTRVDAGTPPRPHSQEGGDALVGRAVRLQAWLPRGGTLPQDVWDARHRVIVRIGYAMSLVITALALVFDRADVGWLTIGLWVAVPTFLADRVLTGRTSRSAVASLALMVGCGVCIAAVHGATEAHFTFFVVIGLLTLYQDRVPFVVAIVYVFLHHGILGTLMPMYVFDHHGGMSEPWAWAAIHGAFVLAASLTYIAAWRMNEEYRSDAVRSATRLAESEQRFRALVQQSSDLTLVCDRTGALTYVSPASASLLGIHDDDLVGQDLRGLVEPDDWPGLWRQVEDGDRTHAGPLECRMVAADGSARWVQVTLSDLQQEVAVSGVVLNVRDVSERHRLETELRHAQKLESVGQLAAGIAHEINTPIQFIGDNLRFIMDSYAGRSRLVQAYQAGLRPESLEAIRELEQEVDADFIAREVPLAFAQTLEGVNRVATIVRAMKAFGHPGSEEKSPADLNEAVRNTLVVTGNATKHVAEVSTSLGDVPAVWCHPGDVNQVLVNLVVNASHAVADAVAETGRLGRIEVRTRLEGEVAVIEVSDTGGGISPDIADRVFEPFFTTKEVGRGTGQGLALCYSLVVDRHGGTIEFDSRPGSGTTFTVRLPVGAAR